MYTRAPNAPDVISFLIKTTSVAMTTTVSTISAALDRFSALLIFYHTANRQSYNTCQYKSYNYRSHYAISLLSVSASAFRNHSGFGWLITTKAFLYLTHTAGSGALSRNRHRPYNIRKNILLTLTRILVISLLLIPLHPSSGYLPLYKGGTEDKWMQ